MKGRVLIIAGSDSGSGAGVQADIKSVMAMGGYASTAITAVTVQDTQKVHAVHPIPVDVVARQFSVIFDDIGADAIKTGMLGDAPLIEAIAALLEQKAQGIPLVIDPVMRSSSGDALLQDSALSVLKTKLLPKATLMTPNIPEAEALLNYRIMSAAQMPEAAKELQRITGCKAVLLKGGHLEGDTITDVLWDGNELTQWQTRRFQSASTHGTGCTLASAIATGLAQHMPLKKAVSRARKYLIGAIKHAPRLGKGQGPLNHGWKN